MKNEQNRGLFSCTCGFLISTLSNILSSIIVQCIIPMIWKENASMPDSMKIQILASLSLSLCILGISLALYPIALKYLPKAGTHIERTFPWLGKYNSRKFRFASDKLAYKSFLKRENIRIAIYTLIFVCSIHQLLRLEGTEFDILAISTPLWLIMLFSFFRIELYILLRVGVYSWSPVKGRWHWLLRWIVIDNSRKSRKITGETIQLMIAAR